MRSVSVRALGAATEAVRLLSRHDDARKDSAAQLDLPGQLCRNRRAPAWPLPSTRHFQFQISMASIAASCRRAGTCATSDAASCAANCALSAASIEGVKLAGTHSFHSTTGNNFSSCRRSNQPVNGTLRPPQNFKGSFEISTWTWNHIEFRKPMTITKIVSKQAGRVENSNRLNSAPWCHARLCGESLALRTKRLRYDRGRTADQSFVVSLRT